jgi:hypothetical protein
MVVFKEIVVNVTSVGSLANTASQLFTGTTLNALEIVQRGSDQYSVIVAQT